jgi:hypothetical protein
MFNCCVFPFLGLLLPLDDDVNEVKELRSFFRLSFSQRSLFDEIIPKEEIFPSYENLSGVCVSVLVAHGATEI